MERKIYKCTCCEKVWQSKAHYTRHLTRLERRKIREENKVAIKMDCDICGRIVSKKSVLEPHMKLCAEKKIRREEKQIEHAKIRYKIMRNQFKNMIAKKEKEHRAFIRNLNNILKEHIKKVRIMKRQKLV